MKKFLSKISSLKYIFLIIAFTIIVCIPCFNNDLDVYYDDGSQHISRAYSSYLSLINGENETVLSNLTNGFRV